MKTTIDKAGRLVIPAALRDQVGLVPGPVSVRVVGSAIQVESAAADRLVDVEGLLLLDDADGDVLTADQIRELRLADQR